MLVLGYGRGGQSKAGNPVWRANDHLGQGNQGVPCAIPSEKILLSKQGWRYSYIAGAKRMRCDSTSRRGMNYMLRDCILGRGGTVNEIDVYGGGRMKLPLPS